MKFLQAFLANILFKVMIIKTLKEHTENYNSTKKARETMKENQLEIKNTISYIKNTVEMIKS